MIHINRITHLIGALFVGMTFGSAITSAKPLKVFILAGQSNMQGSAHMSTFAAMGDDPKTAPLLKQVTDPDDHPIVCENAWITYRTNRQQKGITLQGKVKVGYGFDDQRIGPEYGFAIAMDKAHQEPVLIIKTAWGGKSLAVDFRPPSAGSYKPSDKERERKQIPEKDEVGHYYREMIRFIQQTLKDTDSIKGVVPNYDAQQGYELAGFVWFQGWNDMCNAHHIAQYTDNMLHFIEDVRKDLETPKLPFVVGVLGVYGTDPDSRKFDKGLPVSTFRKTQFAAAERYNKKIAGPPRGPVVAVDSGPYYDLKLSDIYWKRRMTANWKQRIKKGEMTTEKFKEECAKYNFGDGELTKDEQRTWDRESSNAEYHYLGSAKTFLQIGNAFAKSLIKLNQK